MEITSMQEKVYVYYQPLENVTPEILKQFMRLNRQLNGVMRSNLYHYFNKYHYRKMKDGMVYYIMEDDKVISWSMIYKEKFNRTWEYNIDIYTKPSYRRQQYADCILRLIKKHYKNKFSCAFHLTTLYNRHRMVR